MSVFINTVDLLGDEFVAKSIIEGTITEFRDNTIKKVRESIFEGCAQLTTVDLPNVTTMDSNAFNNCTQLSSINFPTLSGPLRAGGFRNCENLTAVYLPNITGLYQSVFEGCKRLAIIDLPKVAYAGQNRVFTDCVSLVTVILRNTDSIATIGSTSVFSNTPISSGTGYIYVPRNLVDSYKSATNWSTYASQIRAIEDYPEITGG